jgi:hypothetical protein
MMRLHKISSWLAAVVVYSLFLAAGCAPVAEQAIEPEVKLEEKIPEAAVEEAVAAAVEEPAAEEAITVPAEEAAEPEAELEVKVPEAEPAGTATLKLKFTPEDSTTYKLIDETRRSVKWEGSIPDESAFKGGDKQKRLEMTFTQQIESVDDEGNAVVKITVDALKYLSKTKDKITMEFDSSDIKDPEHQLANLLGQSYTIKLTPAGEAEALDAKEARSAVGRSRRVPKTGFALLWPDAIKERHTVPALPLAGKNQLRPGDKWGKIKTFSFGLMGLKSYKKIYTLKELKDQGDHQIAIIEMNAVPTSKTAEQQEQPEISEQFDSTGTYTGQLKLDLSTGKVEKYNEELRSEWIVAPPSAQQPENEEPAVLTMSETHIYSLEKID